MAEIRQNVDPEDFRQSARHTLFVEGGGSEAIDPQVLNFLLRNRGVNIRIMTLGHSSNVRSVAQALYPYHPDYYFLIDRDHHDQNVVERSWRNFPDEKTDNLLIWRRREIENYFLIPEYLVKSPYLNSSLDELKKCIREAAHKRIFLDAANIVILKLKRELKQDWIEMFKDTDWVNGFDTKEKALGQLTGRHEHAKKQCDILEKLGSYPVTDHFTGVVEELFSGQTELEFGKGSWLEMVKGKSVLHTIINTCFQVKDATGKLLQGSDRMTEVVRSLLKLPLEDQPDDFRELYRLIAGRVK